MNLIRSTLMGCTLALAIAPRPSVGQLPPVPVPVPVPVVPTPVPVQPAKPTQASIKVTVTPAGEVAPGTLVKIDLSGTVGTSVRVRGKVPAGSFDWVAPLRVGYFATPLEGDYSFDVTVTLLDWDTKVFDQAEDTITIPVHPSRPAPPVVPVPGPVPVTPVPVTPTPGPVVPTPVVPTPVQPVPPAFAGHMHAVLIWDADNDEPPSVKVRVARSIASDLAAANCQWWVYTATEAGARYASYLRGNPAPVVLFLDDKGALLGTLPIAAGTAAADVVAKVKAIRAGSN